MMRKEKLKIFCKVAIEEACKRHKIEIEIIKVMDEHVHMIADIPRTFFKALSQKPDRGLIDYLVVFSHGQPTYLTMESSIKPENIQSIDDVVTKKQLKI